jgi:hypothetical protein
LIDYSFGPKEACFEGKVNCCSDTINKACKEGFKCFNGSCQKELGCLSFLENYEDNDSEVLPVANYVFEPVHFAKGFNEGFSFFDKLPHHETCDSFDKEIVGDIIVIYDLIKQISKENIIQILEEIRGKLAAVFRRMEQGQSCKEWVEELKKFLNELADYINSDNYSQRMSVHTFRLMKQIRESIIAAVDFFDSGNYNSGWRIGDVLKFTLFWDFKPKN